MKFGKPAQVALIATVALATATLFTACQQYTSTLTVDFLYVATNQQVPGQIQVYEVNSESGVLRPIPTSPFPSGGRNPVAEVVSPNYLNLYVINEDDNDIVQMGIGTDGKLYPQNTVNTAGSFPVSEAMNAQGNYLYAVDTYSPIPSCAATNPCPGDLAVYALDSTGKPSSPIFNSDAHPNYWPLQASSTDSKTVVTPTAVNALANGKYVYVTAYNPTTNSTTTNPSNSPTSAQGYLFAFQVNSNGTLTQLNNGQPILSGILPSAMASDPTSSYLYVADNKLGQITTYSVQSGIPTVVATAASGSLPLSMSLDTVGNLYVANAGDSTMKMYSTSASGTLTLTGTYAVGTYPVAVLPDPHALGFIYTANFLGNNMSGFQISRNSGTLVNTQNSPYPSMVQPTAIAGVPHAGSIH